jgi:hypothetical protein
MDIIRKETLFSWLWRKTYKENLPFFHIVVVILYLLLSQSL